MSALSDQLRARWESEGLRILPGASAEAVRAFESHYGVLLPEDFRDYVMTVDGMEVAEMDNELLAFYSLCQIAKERAKPPLGPSMLDGLEDPTGYFVIADWSIWACGYAIYLSSSREGSHPVLRITGGSPPWEKMADSFSEFLALYLADPRALLR